MMKIITFYQESELKTNLIWIALVVSTGYLIDAVVAIDFSVATIREWLTAAIVTLKVAS
jgi:hypothetical protein